jgi:monoamine oxidase
VGAGFAGIGMAIRLKQEGIEDFLLLERADDVGGVRRYNTYPGCRCEVPSQSGSRAGGQGRRRSDLGMDSTTNRPFAVPLPVFCEAGLPRIGRNYYIYL